MTVVSFSRVKAAAQRLTVGHLARELILLQPDELPVEQFDALLPALLRLLAPG